MPVRNTITLGRSEHVAGILLHRTPVSLDRHIPGDWLIALKAGLICVLCASRCLGGMLPEQRKATLESIYSRYSNATSKLSALEIEFTTTTTTSMQAMSFSRQAGVRSFPLTDSIRARMVARGKDVNLSYTRNVVYSEGRPKVFSTQVTIFDGIRSVFQNTGDGMTKITNLPGGLTQAEELVCHHTFLSFGLQPPCLDWQRLGEDRVENIAMLARSGLVSLSMADVETSSTRRPTVQETVVLSHRRRSGHVIYWTFASPSFVALSMEDWEAGKLHERKDFLDWILDEEGSELMPKTIQRKFYTYSYTDTGAAIDLAQPSAISVTAVSKVITGDAVDSDVLYREPSTNDTWDVSGQVYSIHRSDYK